MPPKSLWVSKKKYIEQHKENENGIMNLEKEIKSQKQDILRFQDFFYTNEG